MPGSAHPFMLGCAVKKKFIGSTVMKSLRSSVFAFTLRAALPITSLVKAMVFAHLLTTVSTGLVRAQGQAGRTDERVIDIPSPFGADQRVLFVAPSKPRAVIVMLPGGSGDIGLSNGGEIRHDDNFVVRTRTQWAAIRSSPSSVTGCRIIFIDVGTAMGRSIDDVMSACVRFFDGPPSAEPDWWLIFERIVHAGFSAPNHAWLRSKEKSNGSTIMKSLRSSVF